MTSVDKNIKYAASHISVHNNRARTALSIAIILIICVFVFIFMNTTGTFYYKMVSAVAAAEKCSKYDSKGKRASQYQKWLAEIKHTLGQTFQYNIESHEDDEEEEDTEDDVENGKSCHHLSNNSDAATLRPVIYVLNHPHLKYTLFDYVALAHLKRDHSVTLRKDNYDQVSILRRALEGSDPIMLYGNKDTRVAPNQFEHFKNSCRERFAQGRSVALFPERHATNMEPFVVRKFKSGAFHVSTLLGVPVVYVVTDPTPGIDFFTEKKAFNLYVSRPYYATEFSTVDDFKDQIQLKMQTALTKFNC